MWIDFTLCFLTLNVLENVYAVGDNSRSTFPVKRDVDGRRGSKYFEVPIDDSFDVYDSYDSDPDFSDYRSNIPGEPGLDYPSFTRIPQTSFTCEREYRGYYADEEAGCQLFHVCDGNFLVSSFLCPVGSTFSQKLLTCDWWNKVDCSATRNFYQVNNQIIISEVDDDEILRKAYEMSSLQSTRSGVAVVDPKRQFNNDVNRRLSHVNDLQSGVDNQYSDYQNSPSISRKNYPQFKYSSRYSSALDQHDRDIDYFPRPPDDPKSLIQVDTIGKDYRNDNDEQLNRFQPSYAPTVPTITTTTRRYYSPTIPTIIHSTVGSGKYDLEFESSDHLYSAKGKRPSISMENAVQSTTDNIKTTLPTVTPPTLDTNTPFFNVEFLPVTTPNTMSSSIIQNESGSLALPSLQYQPPVNKEDKKIATDEFPAAVFYVRANDTTKNSTDYLKLEEQSIITNPSTEILPPFFYYSNVEQHDAVLKDTSEKLIFNLTAVDDSAVASSHDSVSVKNYERAEDTVEEESSPFQVTVTLKNNEEFYSNGELLKSPTAQQDLSTSQQIQDIKIVKSEHYKKFDDIQKIPVTQRNEKTKLTVNNYSNSNAPLKIIDIMPRPFSLNPPQKFQINVSSKNATTEDFSNYSSAKTNLNSYSIRTNEVTTPSLPLININTTKIDKTLSDYSEKVKIPNQAIQTFQQSSYNVDNQTMFDIPSRERSINIQNEKPLSHQERQVENKNKNEETSAIDENKKETLVETELVPSLGFALNTDEEREQYVEAVLGGLFKDINVTEIEMKSVNMSEV